MSDDLQEIISRPPSHPIATTLLVTSIFGTILAIFFVWQELFGEYLPTAAPGQSNNSRTIAEQHLHDHYGRDFKGQNILADVEKELGINSKVGGDHGLGTATGNEGGGENAGGNEGGGDG